MIDKLTGKLLVDQGTGMPQQCADPADYAFASTWALHQTMPAIACNSASWGVFTTAIRPCSRSAYGWW